MDVSASLFWKDNICKTIAVLTKSDNCILELKIGDFITYDGRNDEGVKIVEFTWKSSDERGPVGMIYLPWRSTEKRWAKLAWTLKGNMRHIIAFPVGMNHYGQQINWDSVKILGECPNELKSSEDLIDTIKDLRLAKNNSVP